MAVKWDTRQMAARGASLAAFYAASKMLQSTRGKKVTRKSDRFVDRVQRKLARNAKRAEKNAGSRPAFLAAGVASLAAAAFFLTKAARKS